MAPPSRIAILGRDQGGLGARSRELLSGCEFRRFADPFVQFDQLQQFAPELCLVVGSPPEFELFGLLRLLRERDEGLRILVAVDQESFRQCRALCERIGAEVCTTPIDDPSLLRALIGEEPESADSRDEAERLFYELCRSLSDEVNNPLLFIDGHLALLEVRREGGLEQDEQDLLDAARQGIARIARCLDTLRFASDAHPRPDLTSSHPLSEALEEAHRRSDEPVRQRLGPLPTDAGVGVEVDRRLCVESLRRLLHLTADLADPDTKVDLSLQQDERHGLLEFRLQSARLRAGTQPELARAVLTRGALRGTPAALRLSVLDLAIRRHGGRFELRGDGDVLVLTTGWPRASQAPTPPAD